MFWKGKPSRKVGDGKWHEGGEGFLSDGVDSQRRPSTFCYSAAAADRAAVYVVGRVGDMISTPLAAGP